MGDKLYTFSFKEGFKRARKKGGYTQKSFAEKFNVSIETVKNWEQGRNVPEIETLEKLCNFFQCDVDYLLGNIECETHDIQFIHDKTGLSKEAINFLINENSRNVIGKLIVNKFSIPYNSGENPYIILINYLLDRNNDTTPLLDYLYQYIFRSDFKYCIDDNDNLRASVKLTDEKNQSYTYYNVSLLYNMLLLNINNCLSDIRKKYIEKRDAKKAPDTN